MRRKIKAIVSKVAATAAILAMVSSNGTGFVYASEAADETGTVGGEITSEADTAADETANETGTVGGEITNEADIVTDETSNEADAVDGESSNEDSQSEESTAEVQVATNLRWSEEIPGEAVFYNPNEGNVSYVLHLYQDGEQIMTWWGSLYGAGDCQIDTYFDIEKSGTYTYIVELFAYGVEQDGDITSGYVSETSPAFIYIRPEEQLSIPECELNSSTGTVIVKNTEDALYYWAYLYYADSNYESGYCLVVGFGSQDGNMDFSSYLSSGYNYYVRVRVISNDIKSYAHSNYSDYIPFNVSEAGDTVSAKLDEAMQETDSENINVVVQTVKDTFADVDSKSELQIAMQTDSEVQEKVRTLESLYKENMNLTTSVASAEDTGIDASSVALLGAALNATQSNGSITFNMSKPDEETRKNLVTNSGFSNAIVLDLELEGAGITKGEILAVPVTVTMKAPEEIDISRLAILHYNDDGTYETLPVRKNADGTISFTVTHFSNFVFGEQESTENDNSRPSSDSEAAGGAAGGNSQTGNNSAGSSSSSGSGASGAVHTYVWMPETEDEIRRYSVRGRENINYTVDKENTYSVTVINEMQGRRCFDSFEAVLGDYVIGRTYNILPEGRIVYQMDSTARITIVIPKELQSDHREYKMICVTEGGLPILLDDLDEIQNTITFETDTYYAFALIYKDVVMAE